MEVTHPPGHTVVRRLWPCRAHPSQPHLSEGCRTI